MCSTRPTTNSMTMRRTTSRNSLTERNSFVGLLAMFAISLHRRAGGGPNEIGAVNSRVPKLAQLRRDLLPHFGHYTVVPTDLGQWIALATDKPNGRGESGCCSRPLPRRHLSPNGPAS